MGELMPYKVILCGKSGVGKTTLYRWSVEERYTVQDNYICTNQYFKKLYNIGERTVAIQLWDTLGQERYDSLTESYFRNADAAIYVYSVDDMDSVLRFNYYEDKLRAEDNNRAVKVLRFIVGNKKDLASTVELGFAKDACKKYKCVLPDPILTSAKSGNGVLDMFNTIAEIVADKAQPHEFPSKSSTIDPSATKPRKKYKC